MFVVVFKPHMYIFKSCGGHVQYLIKRYSWNLKLIFCHFLRSVTMKARVHRRISQRTQHIFPKSMGCRSICIYASRNLQMLPLCKEYHHKIKGCSGTLKMAVCLFSRPSSLELLAYLPQPSCPATRFWIACRFKDKRSLCRSNSLSLFISMMKLCSTALHHSTTK